MVVAALVLTGLSLGIWGFLLLFWGQFWRADQQLDDSGDRAIAADHANETDESLPRVCAVIPARNEADLLPITLRSLLLQTYPGELTLVLVDDQSTDDTSAVAQRTAQALDAAERLTVLPGQPLPSGWSGKLWAMAQGVRYARQQPDAPDYFLLTDADIEHDAENLQQLITKAEQEGLDMVSLMVRLRCQSLWEAALIPAFVFFFQKLYPFRWVNAPAHPMAAAAGGCILVRQSALARIGGLQTVRQALIDDCALAAAIKGHPQQGGKLWLGLARTTRSLRPYPSLQSLWEMVARTAYTQLHYSPWLLGLAVLGMGLTYLMAPVGAALGLWWGNGWLLGLGLVTWGLMAVAYGPTLRLYGRSPLWGLALPAIALLYTLMTLDSARRHWQGRGGAWKGRVYPG